MSDLDRRLKEFVDRKGEVERFERFFSDPEKIALAVAGPTGRGKSLLRMKLVKKCTDDGIDYAVLVNTSDNFHDFRAILGCCHQKFGEEKFPRFTAALKTPVTAPVDVNLHTGNIRVLENAQISGSVGAVTGLILNNPQFNVSGLPTVTPMELRRKLTSEFLADLQSATVAAPLVVFLDAAEKLMPETLSWLWQTFVPALGEHEIRCVKIVFLSQIPPDANSDVDIYIERTELPPLDVPDIEEYLELKGCNKVLAPLMKQFTNGEPLAVVQQTELYKRGQSGQASP